MPGWYYLGESLLVGLFCGVVLNFDFFFDLWIQVSIRHMTVKNLCVMIKKEESYENYSIGTIGIKIKAKHYTHSIPVHASQKVGIPGMRDVPYY